jgi:hypothetical protein
MIVQLGRELKTVCKNVCKTTKPPDIGGFSDPAGIRTQDPYIKSVMLYLLSYGIFHPPKLYAEVGFPSAKVLCVGGHFFIRIVSVKKHFVCGPDL